MTSNNRRSLTVAALMDVCATIGNRVRLPIDELIPDILQHLRSANTLVLEAPPGAGKTTRVPPALLELDDREVLVLEPRRLAARLAARYVAGERQERVGETVGYQVRFEEVAGARTRLRFLTEGVLTRRLLSDPALDRVACVVLDEFHERHLEGDLALALLRRLQRTRRPDLKLVVMSATLDTAPIAGYLDDARILRSSGRQHALEIEYTPHSAAPLDEQVAAALERLAASGFPGHALVFLPGAFEIRRAQTACAAMARRRNWRLLPLYGDQSPEEQDRAVAPSAETKIILSTNVAESSITIDGVSAVIDSGLARVASHSPWSGLPTLQVARISQASANQRAGRAGRTGPGRAIRLYPLDDFARRPAQDVPQILREDLAPTALLLQAMETDLGSLDWLDAPPAAAIEHARELLRMLGASGGTAREMARYPLHPRLARLIVEARRRGVPQEGAAIAGLLSAGERLPQRVPHGSRSDLLVLLESEWSPYAARLVRQLNGGAARGGLRNVEREDALLISVLTAFPDRVARRRQGSDLQLASGSSAQLAPNSTLTADLMVAVEAEDRKDQGSPLVRLASAIEPEWLVDLFPDRLRETNTLEWQRSGERVEAVTSLLFDQIPLETRRTTPDPEAAGVFLAHKAVEAGLGRFADMEEIAAFQSRVNFAAQHGAVARLDDAAIEAALAQLAAGLKSFSELEAAAGRGGLLRAIEQAMPGPSRRLLEELAPSSIKLPRGRQVRVHYEAGQPPWIASRLQDFFGMRETPAVGRGKSPLVIRLLAPNQRPVQMTSDLAGFWERLYPQVRRELARRYPKHSWPEDPLR
uniref:ATP-dependent helicase HrpB n=1 Tax=Solibacter usitatus (strain Ellin6076) TaxID=234267 RepID=Q01ZA3_SOLUE